MKKTLFLLPTLILGLTTTYGQSENTEPNFTKHQIGLDIGGPASILLGNRNNAFNSGIQYKFRINEKWRLRSSFDYENYQYNQWQGQINFDEAGMPFFRTRSSRSNQFTIGGGVERLIPIKKFVFFIGIEGFAGKSFSNFSENDYALLDGEGAVLSETTYHWGQDWKSTSGNTDVSIYGANFYLGTDWNFAERFSLGAQLNFQSLFSAHNRTNETETLRENGEVIFTETRLIENKYRNGVFNLVPFKLYLNFNF